MVQPRPTTPAGHGELVEQPAFDAWAALVAHNRELTAGWDFELGGLSAAEMRALARREALESASAFSGRLGVSLRAPGAPDAPIVATGHQPELYHPGVWVKDFLLQRLAEQTGATAFDLVVDSDGFDSVALSSPCLRPGVSRCRAYLALGAQDGCYASTPVPAASEIDDFCRAAAENLSTLSAPAVARHFDAFCTELRSAANDAENLAELVTFARRRFESSAGTDYLELPVTEVARTEAYRRFVAGVALDARRFAQAYNEELAQYRAVHKTRSAAQPFPDLEIGGELIELPFWAIRAGHRTSVSVRALADGGVEMLAGSEPFVSLPADHAAAADALLAADVVVAPKAVALTLFTRVFACDLFIHGVGGGRYDRVTDGLVRRYLGVEPPAFAVASLTVYLPLGAHLVTDEEVAEAKDRLNRLEHNPDALLAEVDFDEPAEQSKAAALAEEKARLVMQIATPDADKKALGLRIREVNAELSSLLAPLKDHYAAELAALESQREANEILTDRTYPFCFWSPEEIADKVR